MASGQALGGPQHAIDLTSMGLSRSSDVDWQVEHGWGK